jgi:carboxymethylenebutenolidase
VDSSFLHELVPCQENKLARRKLLKSLLAVASGYTAARLLLDPYAVGASSPLPQDAAVANVDADTIHYSFGETQIEGYLAKPKGDSKYPAILVIHDRAGLNGSVRDVTKRFAAEGFVAMAPDLLSGAGGTGKFKGPEVAAAVNRIPINIGLDDLKAGFEYLQKNPNVDPQKISVVGFGWGGWRAFSLASMEPDLYRTVVFYASTPVNGLEDVHAPVLANYAQFDFRNTGNAIPTRNQMKELGKKFSYFDYPNTYAGFFSPGPRFDSDAAKLAWSRTLDFLRS